MITGDNSQSVFGPAADPADGSASGPASELAGGSASGPSTEPASGIVSGPETAPTYRTALKAGEASLADAGVPDAALDAWYLLEYVLKNTGIPDAGRAWYFLHSEEEIPEARGLRYQELIRKRCMRIPLQYLTGEQEFMGIPFLVNEHVLIPRQDTETLVEEAMKHIRPGMSVLDVCTGSGCIIISLVKLSESMYAAAADKTGSGRGGGLARPAIIHTVAASRSGSARNTAPAQPAAIRAAATDLSEPALKVARENDRRQKTGIRFIQGDLFENVTGTYDVIVSNPPYIPTGDLATLMDEVRIHEPQIALDGHSDGLYFYRRLAAESKNYLNPGGWLLMEIGCDQGENVENLLKKAGFCDISVKKDLAGLDRVVSGKLTSRPA